MKYLHGCFLGCACGACGGFCLVHYFHATLPEIFETRKYRIRILEMYGIVVWGNHFTGQNIQMYCDILAKSVNSGKANCEDFRIIERNSIMAPLNEFKIRMIHLSNEFNQISNHLSRWNLDISHRLKLFELVESCKLTEHGVSNSLFHLSQFGIIYFQINNWKH